MKFKVQIDEVATFSHEVIIEADTNFELDRALDELESKGDHPDDIPYYLNEENGIKIVKFTKDESGDCRFECPDYSEMSYCHIGEDVDE